MHGRKTAVETKSMLSGANGQLVIPPNPHRCAVLLGNPGARTTLVSIGAGHTTGQGIPINATVAYLMLSAAQVGDAITAAITLEDSAAAQQTYTWTEWVYAA